MCGISGLYNFTNKKIHPLQINKIISSITHRGPDNQNYWIKDDRKLALINTRLAIQDISKNGNQPFISNNKNFILVFNGEIYNFNELRKELKNEFNFKSNSDTEVLLNLYIKYKKNCLKKLKGMYSFAIYDKTNDELFIARDPFGVKPLYYYFNNTCFFFSSEIKTFFSLNIEKKINLRSLSSYLVSEYSENIKKTFYKNINKLQSGHFLILKNKKLSIKKYFSFSQEVDKLKIPKNDITKNNYFLDLIQKTVKQSTISDVPISISSSGGLDSSILHYEALKFNKQIDLISWDFKEKIFSEKKFVNKISKITGLTPKFQLYTKEIFKNNIEDIIKINEEPFSGTPVAAYHSMLKNICNNKVVLDGSGLDEAHGGYDKYYLKNKRFSSLSQDGSDSINDTIYNKKFLQKYPTYDDELPKINGLHSKMYSDLFYIKLPRALRFRDKISMSLGKEIRPSFLDTELIGSLFKLRKKDHYNKSFSKYLLRDIYKGKITRNIVFSNKRNIQTPQTLWLSENLINFINKTLLNSYIWDLGIYDKKMFFYALTNFKKLKLKNSFFIWKILNLHFLIKSL